MSEEKATVEGLKKGEFVVGPLGGRRYLFCVNRVLGKHSVEAIAFIDGMVTTINLQTFQWHSKDSEWKKVRWREEMPEGETHGRMFDTGYMVDA